MWIRSHAGQAATLTATGTTLAPQELQNIILRRMERLPAKNVL